MPFSFASARLNALQAAVRHPHKQATIETSVFGAEFVAMKIGMESLRGLRYKLRMMGVGIAGPSYIYGDNMSVIHVTISTNGYLQLVT